jgi:hypothetical protein
MNLSFGQNGSSSPSYLAGTFVGIATIVSAKDISKQDIFNNGNPVDCGVSLTLDVGRDFQPEFRIYGNFKSDAGKLSWGSAFKVKELFNKLGIEGKLNDDGTIPEEALLAMQGRQVIRLSYVRGFNSNTNKKQYADYQHVETCSDFNNEKEVEKVSKDLTNKFLKDVQAGWIKNYSPNAGSLVDAINAVQFP